MSRRFQVLLDRYAIIRREIDAERDQPRPNELRLVRLKRLQLLINTRIREFVGSARYSTCVGAAPATGLCLHQWRERAHELTSCACDRLPERESEAPTKCVSGRLDEGESETPNKNGRNLAVPP